MRRKVHGRDYKPGVIPSRARNPFRSHQL